MRRSVPANPIRWVVAFPGRRDSYQVPLALAEHAQLEAFVTDQYAAMDRTWFATASKFLPSGFASKLRKRYVEGLPSAVVRTPSLALGAFGVPRNVNQALAELTLKIAAKTGAGIFSYAHIAYPIFTKAPKDRPRVLFQHHPHPASLVKLYVEEIKRVPEARNSLEAEFEMHATPRYLEEISSEALLADYCVVASNYTRKTLIENGVSAEKIFVIPYGVDLEYFRPGLEPHGSDFTVLLPGQLTQRKGVFYLLEAWKRLRLRNAKLLLAGYGSHPGVLEAARGVAEVRGKVSDREMQTLLQTSDVCCVPSIAEGFGLVYLEALACGTPIIGTPNTGAADIIRDGEQGFIVPIRNVDALAERLLWCYEHRDALREMRVPARALAEEFPWERFRRSLLESTAIITNNFTELSGCKEEVHG